MKMRLLNKQLMINDVSNTVELRLNIGVPMEIVSAGDYAILPAEFYEQIGRNLVELLDE